MKKAIYVAVALLVVIVILVVGCVYWFFSQAQPQAEPAGVKIFDGQGGLMVHAMDVADLYESEYWAYLEVVLVEVCGILPSESEEEAVPEELFVNGYEIHTSFDPAIYTALDNVCADWGTDMPLGCAVTDLEGALLAVYSADPVDSLVNHVTTQTSPYSAFKPLSVYTPAVEAGIINWSTLYHDSPYKQLEQDGVLRDWPQNASLTYSQKDVTVYDGLRKSLNTVAVKCLAQLGVIESIAFLQDSFGIPMVEEEYVALTYGEEEVVGNVALGYLETGVTPIDMAGYYQIFATGGIYSAPKAIKLIRGPEGDTVYIRTAEDKQVVSAATADTMNKLLQGVVAPGGTGETAFCDDVAVAGKTGTGDYNSDNWFVGVTPGYSCAVWHDEYDRNIADDIFAQIIRRIYKDQPDANRNFITHKNLFQKAYCAESGMIAGDKCTSIGVGYYASEMGMPTCDKHN